MTHALIDHHRPGLRGGHARHAHPEPGTAEEATAPNALSTSRTLGSLLADGEDLVFSLLANNFGASSEGVDRTMDAILVRLAEFTRR